MKNILRHALKSLESQMFNLMSNQEAVCVLRHGDGAPDESAHALTHIVKPNRQTVSDGVPLPSASCSAESAFLCPSPL